MVHECFVLFALVTTQNVVSQSLERVLEKDRFYVSGSSGSHVIKRERPTIFFMTGNTRNLWKKDDTVLLTRTMFCANTPLTYVPNILLLHADIM